MRINDCNALACLKNLEGPHSTLYARGIHVEESIPEGALLFIGINPSFKEGYPIPGMKEYSPTYSLNNIDHPYFNKAKEIAAKMNLPFGHHDLFPIRERDQKVIEQMFDGDNGPLVPKEDYSRFIEAALAWSKATITEAKPKMIVVINTFASRLFFDACIDGRSLLGFKPANGDLWNEELGADFVRINGQAVPILFSGMLSGQRVLDRYSEFRLCWHIQHILSHPDIWPK
ncbi:MAG: hypothetical protein IKZ60_02130 [Bacteroidales bacterium]|nr:hypothetical protein [Bacteroidales bacterium]